MADSTAILVLGMHRSGTSAAAGWLQALGVSFGSYFTAEDPTQPKGYFEHPEILAIHEELMATFNSSWDDPRPLPKAWEHDHRVAFFRAQLVEIIRRDLATQPLWGAKDPRLCRLLPLWLAILDELCVAVRAICVLRHPAEVAGSLENRNQFSPDRSGLLWLRYVLEAEQHSRSVPRITVRYPDLLRDWRAEAQAVAKGLGIVWPKSYEEAAPAVADFLERNLRHHESSSFDGFAPPLREWLVSAYGALQLRRGTDEHSRTILDNIHGELVDDPFVAKIQSIAHPSFFNGEVSEGHSLYHLTFEYFYGTFFGYYSCQYYPWLYHFGLGFEYVYDAKDGARGVYFYDPGLKTFLYTSPRLFPYFYDFGSNSWLFYYQGTSRYFYDFGSRGLFFSAPG